MRCYASIVAQDWERVITGVLRPARPELGRCLEATRRWRERRGADRRERLRALADCERRIVEARGRVFAARDGVVGGEMTALEREWRELARREDATLAELWRELAPSSPPALAARGLDPSVAAVTLASDPAGVAEVERAAAALRAALEPWGVVVGARVEWTLGRTIALTTPAAELLAAPTRAALEVLGADAHAVRGRAHRLGRSFRPSLAHAHDAGLFAAGSPVRELRQLALASALWDAARERSPALALRDDPVEPLLAVWRAGYVPCRVDARSVAIAAPLVAIDGRDPAG